MTDGLVLETQEKMKKAVEGLGVEIRKIRTGRAHPNLLDHITVDSYGSKMPLPQVATITVEGARSILVSPWDKKQVAAIEKAIRVADLGLNPATHGDSVRVPLPALTEERRKDLIKLAKEVAENGKIAIRNVRRASLQDVKTALKEKTISEDEERTLENKINDVTEKHVEMVQSILNDKIKDLQEVK
jgi:ribosome recycling factor